MIDILTITLLVSQYSTVATCICDDKDTVLPFLEDLHTKLPYRWCLLEGIDVHGLDQPS